MLTLLKDRVIKGCFMTKDRVIIGCFVIKDRVINGCFVTKDRVIIGYFLIKDRVIRLIQAIIIKIISVKIHKNTSFLIIFYCLCPI